MQIIDLQFKRMFMVMLSLLFLGAMTVDTVSAEAPNYTLQEGCVIPESGPWPPCATNGSSRTTAPTTNTNDTCVIPQSGPWPPCATNGGGNTTPTGGNSGECIIPQSGPWPPCATDGSNGSPAQPGECVIPQSGRWPPCATNGGPPGATISAHEINLRIDLALEQLQVYWQFELRNLGRNYRPPSRVTTYAGDPNDTPNAFYIPAMDAVFVDVHLLREVTDNFGLYAGVAVLSHEWGHFIQDQLGLLRTDRPLRRIELQADCFSGSFTKYLSDSGQLADGEYESGRQLFYSVGDDVIDPGAPYNRAGAHGTAGERQTAYTYGFNTNFNACLAQYQ